MILFLFLALFIKLLLYLAIVMNVCTCATTCLVLGNIYCNCKISITHMLVLLCAQEDNRAIVNGVN